MEKNYLLSVTLDSENCTGCTNCLKRCPTEAIRVRGGKAKIKKMYCIDCGECIRICPHHAKRAAYDSLDTLADFEYKIALPPPSLYAQFNNLDDKSLVLDALIQFGFDEVFEVAAAAEIISAATRQELRREGVRLPLISSACPSTVRLIRVRFPNLIDNISRLAAPIDLAADLAVKAAITKTGLPREKIGVFFITPCPAKVTSVYSPLGIGKSNVDRVIAVSDIYPKLLSAMKKVYEKYDDDDFSHTNTIAGKIGVSWGNRGGEAAGLIIDRYLAADGIENVIRVLNDLEDNKIHNVDFIELNACAGGCVGGVLTVENPFIANVKLNKLRKYLPVSGTHTEDGFPESIRLTKPIEYLPLFEYGGSVAESIAMMQKIDAQFARLPGLDCGCCGAPSCRAHAEDIIKGKTTENECIHLLKKNLQALAGVSTGISGD
ncbi:MAG: 4Fe-4S binding protein [Oscillospiraceae bacterium]|jgi:iron only hydrogenase large subunit-like protein|nr:4Fe-4S binding protein [Oscillospiraceae bacterium]